MRALSGSNTFPWAAPVALVMVLGLTALLYLPGFGGYWLGDDFGHVHRLFFAAQEGSVWKSTLAMFAQPADALGQFYRPMIFVSLAADWSWYGSRYAGWFVTGLVVHLLNAVLVLIIANHAARSTSRQTGIGCALAALAFALSPALVEGVMWISARSDLFVTAVTLLSVAIWLWRWDHPSRRHGAILWCVPLLLVFGLGFKESAALLPLQLALLTFALPTERCTGHWRVLIACALLVTAFMLGRGMAFDSAWHPYTQSPGGSLFDALASLPRWWQGTTAAAPMFANIWLGGCVAAFAVAIILCGRVTDTRVRLAMACMLAGGGQLLATLLNLGAMQASGEGGRLLYGAVAWWALALGFVLGPARQRVRNRNWALLLAAGFAVGCGGAAASARIAEFRNAQDELRTLVAAIGRHAGNRDDTTILIVPDSRRGIVMARNAQGALATPPFQRRPLLHRVLPTLPAEFGQRGAQFRNGLGTQLEKLRPGHLDFDTLNKLLEPAASGRTPEVACWSSARRRIEPEATREVPPIDAPCEMQSAPVALRPSIPLP